MPSYVIIDEITGIRTDDTRSPFSGLRDRGFRFATGVWREPELRGTLITRLHLPMRTLSPFLLGSQERATERPDPAPQPAPPLTAKELAEARANARPQVTKNVKPGDTVRK